MVLVYFYFSFGLYSLSVDEHIEACIIDGMLIEVGIFGVLNFLEFIFNHGCIV